MQKLSDNPNQPLQEARVKLRELLTEYVAADLNKALEEGMNEVKSNLSSAVNRMVQETKELRSNVNDTMVDYWDKWDDHWKEWKGISDGLPLKLREQFINDLNGALEHHHRQMLAWYETLSASQERFLDNLDNWLKQTDQQSAARQADFFKNVYTELEGNNREMQSLRENIKQQQDHLSAALQEVKDTAISSMQALPERLNAVENAQATLGNQLASLLEKVESADKRQYKISVYIAISLITGIAILALVGLLIFKSAPG